MSDLGVGAYRFSVAWPRVLPVGYGQANEAGLAFYDRLVDALLAADIEPWLCLYHWDLPQALQDMGGWTSRDSVRWFADYATLIARRYGGRVKRFATFNEPSVFTLLGYGVGQHPPGIKDSTIFVQAIHHVNLAHGAAVDVLRSLVPAASIGAIHCQQPCLPSTPEDKTAAELLDAYWNGAFADPQYLACYPPLLREHIESYICCGDLDRINRPVDWFGLNHYCPIFVKADPDSSLGFASAEPPGEFTRSGIGWPIDPNAFRDTLLAVHKRYRLPIYVLENGIGSHDTRRDDGQIVDDHRIDYLRNYTGAMDSAIAGGADVRGYFVWSLLDNFEWASGYDPRFGLVYVDYSTQQRFPKASFRWYSELIRGGRRR